MSGSGKLVKVAFAQQQAEAEMIQGLLTAHGIPSMVKREPGFDVPDFIAAGPRQILVAEELAEQAREVLEGTPGVG
jgi:Putative prokaryotic signal transducing protein